MFVPVMWLALKLLFVESSESSPKQEILHLGWPELASLWSSYLLFGESKDQEIPEFWNNFNDQIWGSAALIAENPVLVSW